MLKVMRTETSRGSRKPFQEIRQAFFAPNRESRPTSHNHHQTNNQSYSQLLFFPTSISLLSQIASFEANQVDALPSSLLKFAPGLQHTLGIYPPFYSSVLLKSHPGSKFPKRRITKIYDIYPCRTFH